MFIRVKHTVPGYPKHEFDIPEKAFDGERMARVKADPSPTSRPPTYKTGVVSRRTRTTGEDHNNDAPTGATPEEEAS